MSTITLLYSPFPTTEAARTAATMLLKAHLVACCNLLPAAESLYWWQGTLTNSAETILIAKTLPAMAERARVAIAAHHPYECPAILSFPADATPALLH